MHPPHLAYARTARAVLSGGPLLAAVLSKNAADLQRAAQDWPESKDAYFGAIERGRGLWLLVSSIAADRDFDFPDGARADLAIKATAMLQRYMMVAEQPAEPVLGEVLAANRALAQVVSP